jgi:hypothetical protein
VKLSLYAWSQGTHTKLGSCTVGFSNSKWAVVLEQHAGKVWISIHSCRELWVVTIMVWRISTTSLDSFRFQRINKSLLNNTRIDFQNVWALSHSSSKLGGIFKKEHQHLRSKMINHEIYWKRPQHSRTQRRRIKWLEKSRIKWTRAKKLKILAALRAEISTMNQKPLSFSTQDQRRLYRGRKSIQASRDNALINNSSFK